MTTAIVSWVATAAAHTCTKDERSTAMLEWELRAEGVPGVDGYRGGFWDNLNNKDFAGACGSAGGIEWVCGPTEDTGAFYANFFTTKLCNEGHVESAWYEATKNEFGSITCGKAG